MSVEDAMQPGITLLVKLGSIAVHVEEMLSAGGHDYDRVMPVQHNGKLVVCIVMHDETVDRIKQNDPAVVQLEILAQSLGPEVLALPLMMIDVAVFYEPDKQTFVNKCEELANPNAMLKWLSRGYVDRAEDHSPVEYTKISRQ